MNNNKLSTSKASEKLKKDLGLNYSVGKKVVSLFFDSVLESPQGNYWEQKPNYFKLIKESESFNDMKIRIKAKVDKFWYKGSEETDNILLLVPKQEDRKLLYTGAFKLKNDNGGAKLPNPVMIAYLINKLGHYDQHHRGSHNY